MKLFANGAEIRLTQQDLMLMIEVFLNQKLIGMDRQQVTALSLHPGNKYVAQVTIQAENISPKIQKITL